MSLTSANHPAAAPNFDLSRSAQTALDAELATLAAEGREPTQGELDRIHYLAARVGIERHPDVSSRGDFAALWSGIASGLDMGDEASRHSAKLELLCLEQAYPQFAD